MKQRLTMMLAMLLALMLAACSDDNEANDPVDGMKAVASKPSSSGDASPLLRYVPSDTPYVFASLEAMPEDEMEIMWKMAESSMATYQQGFDALRREEDVPAIVKAIVDELDGNMSREGLLNLGLAENGNFAVYGQGVFPVIRMSVDDASKMTAMFDRVMAKSDNMMTRATFDGMDYYRAEADGASILMSVQDDQVVMSLVPSMAVDSLLPSILGTVMPAKNISQSKRLEKANDELGLLPYGTMLIDTVQLAREVLQSDSPGSEVFAEPRTELSATCIDEFIEMAGVVPGLVYGFTGIDDDEVTQRGVIGVRSDIAGTMKNVMRAMPGLGTDNSGMFSFGMGFDIIKLKEFVTAQAQAIQNDPYQCDKLQDMNAHLDQMMAQVNQPLPPFVSNIYGLRVNLLGGNFDGPMPTDLRAMIMVGIDNPGMLLGMGAAMMPELAELELSNDGEPQPLPAGMIPIPLDSPHIAMMKHGLAISIGSGVQDDLQSFLDADVKSPAPFMSMAYSAEGIDMYLDKMYEMTAEYGESNSMVMPNMSEWLDHAETSLFISDRGIEMTSSTYLK